jgi:hypothetical protein
MLDEVVIASAGHACEKWLQDGLHRNPFPLQVLVLLGECDEDPLQRAELAPRVYIQYVSLTKCSVDVVMDCLQMCAPMLTIDQHQYSELV